MTIERDLYRAFKNESAKNKNESFDPDMEMEIISFGIHDGLERFELDGTEFYKDEDETLENAIDTCIDEEFFPDWQEDGAMSYNVDSVKYDAEAGRGTAYVSVYSEVEESAQKDEALNLDRLTDADAKQLIMHLNDFIKDKASKYYHIDKIEAILKKRYKAESAQKDEAKLDRTHIDFDHIGFGLSVKAGFEGKYYTIYLEGYSNNTEKDIEFLSDILVNPKTDAEDVENDRKIREIRKAIVSEISELANEFDAKVLEIVKKHGLKSKKEN